MKDNFPETVLPPFWEIRHISNEAYLWTHDKQSLLLYGIWVMVGLGLEAEEIMPKDNKSACLCDS